MNVMYIAPRFHTNQMSVVKGWIEKGDKVTFISYYTAIIEDYTYVRPIVLGFSLWYYPIDYIYVNVFHRHDPGNTAFKINHGFPPVFKLAREIKKALPDVVIMRDRTLYTMIAFLLCQRYGIASILYNQSPLWDKPPKQDFLHKLARKFSPTCRITPVIGKKEAGKVLDEKAFYVPFVVEPQKSPEEKEYFQNGGIEILSIGKFEPRKHHIMLIEVIKELSLIYADIHLTIIGEATGRLQKEHLQEVLEYIQSNKLEGLVDVEINVPRQKTDAYYLKTDVFIIPSTKEMASISQLEAMSFSVPVIVSNQNGSACYVENGQNGFLFEDCNKKDLKQKMSKMFSDKNKIKQMGAEAYRQVREKYTFDKYYQSIMMILKLIEQ